MPVLGVWQLVRGGSDIKVIPADVQKSESENLPSDT